ncbi:MAG TPA: IPT/TIG domain-containing protein [Terracidiphilus sp.]
MVRRVAGLVVSVILVFLCSCGGGGGTTSSPTPTADFTIGVSPTSGTIAPGGVLSAQVTVGANNGFSESVMVSVTGLPTGATVSPGSSFTMSAGTKGITINIPSNVSKGSFTIEVQGTSGSLAHSVSIALQVQAQTLASFNLSASDKELSFQQGSSATTGIQIVANSIGNTNFDVQLSLSGLPAGVQANLDVNPLAYGESATLKFSSSLTAVANYAAVTVTATRNADQVQESTQLELNVFPAQGTLSAIRTDFVREDGTPAAAVYDPVHKVVYASNPQQNRIDVISPTTRQILQSIQAPNPTGMDLSLDSSRLLVASNVQQIVSIDTASLQVVSRASVPTRLDNISSIPNLIANIANGSSLIGMTNTSDPPSYTLEQWNPVASTFTTLSAPGIGPWINAMSRTGDGEKVLVVDYGSDLNLAVYDAVSNSFTASGISSAGSVLGVAGNPTASQFAIVGSNGLEFVDSDLSVLGQAQLGGIFWGMTYSPDGKNLYVAMTISSAQGIKYPVILTFDTRGYSLTGAAPAFQFAPLFLTSEATAPQSIPFTADATGQVYGTFQFGHGLLIDDATNFQSVLDLPEAPTLGQVGDADEAPLNMQLSTTLGQASFDVLPDVWFGDTRGTEIQFSGGQVAVTAPASASRGLVNVKGVEPDGWMFMVPQSFSYGSQILSAGGNAGSTQGGASLALVGYGLMGNSGNPTVTIGGKTAPVTAASKYIYFNDSGYNSEYSFKDVDELMVMVPQGAQGAGDISVTSSAGTTTLANAFNYIPVMDYPSPDTFTYVLYDPKRHWVYLSAGSQIDVFSADTNQFLTSIKPPSISGARQIAGLALTPDNATLLAANFTDLSVAVINPDSPDAATVVQIPVTVANSPGVEDVVATSNGDVFVDGVSATFGPCGGQVWEFNLASPKPTLRTDMNGFGRTAFSRDSAGDKVLLGNPACGTALWSSTSDTITRSLATLGGSSAASGDGHWFANDYTRLDEHMIQRIQAVTPEFYSNLVVPDLPGEKMNASGSLLYTPLPQGSGRAQSNGIEITDTNVGTAVGYIALSEQLPVLAQSAMDFDEAGNRLFVITSAGLTIVELPPTPVSIGYLSPAAGPASGGTTVTIRGSGFESGATVSVGGVKMSAAFIDPSTLQFTTPGGSPGGARVSIQNGDGSSYSMDAGFIYQ